MDKKKGGSTLKKDFYENKINNSQQLPDLFKELQDIKAGKRPVKFVEEPKKEEIKFNKIYVMNHKFNAAGAVLGILFLILFFNTVHSNYIFATTERKKVIVGEFEKNNNELDMMDIVSKNINELTQKEIITEEVPVEFETVYIENSQLPKDEQIVIREGSSGENKITKIRTYEVEELVDEKIINTVAVNLPVNKIVEIGTSEFLRDMQVHIGDTLYTKNDIYLYSEQNDAEDKRKCIIFQDIDVTLKSEENGWANIIVDGQDGFVKAEELTSEAIMPEVKERNRIKRIILGVNINMPLNTPSGLTREDFIKVLSNNENDVNKIFEQNAEVFYGLEEKYNINGVFVAAMGIHESNWGRSNIANQKKNLFGYGSYDSDAYNSSFTFESYEYGIDLVSKVLVKYYLNPRGSLIYDGEIAAASYYNGPTLNGVNTRYATDPEWANKVYNTMVSLYSKLNY